MTTVLKFIHIIHTYKILCESQMVNLAKFAILICTVISSSAALAEVSANVGVASNYIYRGVTQTTDGAVVSGGLDYAHKSGFYAGTCVYNVDFGPGSEAVEIDLYGGYAGEFDEKFGYDVGYLYYAYPDLANTNWGEIYGSLNYKVFTVGINFIVNSKVADTKASVVEGDIYYYTSAGFDLENDWSVGGTIGYMDFDNDSSANEISYSHFQLDIGKSAGDFGDFTFSLSIASDESGDDDVIPFVSWSKEF